MDGAYFCFISLMTIGFGDFVPGKSYIYNIDEGIEETEANAKLVLGAIYILLGMGIIAMCVNLMQEKIITEVREEFKAEKNYCSPMKKSKYFSPNWTFFFAFLNERKRRYLN